MFLKTTYNTELESGATQFLLKYSGDNNGAQNSDRSDQPPKNARGRGGNNRGGNRNNNYQQKQSYSFCEF